MIDSCIIHTQSAAETQAAGASLASTLYTTPVTILFTGDLGSGKTTFIQGLAQGLGLSQRVQSPTFALEQWYEHDTHTLRHIDLYRLSPEQAVQFVAEHDRPATVTCIEWSERATLPAWPEAVIRIDIQPAQDSSARTITIQFTDVPLPTRTQIETWRQDVALPSNVAEHCDAVAHACDQLAAVYCQHPPRILRPKALHRAAEVHDLLRFIDFKPGAGPSDYLEPSGASSAWPKLRAAYANLHHEAAVAAWLATQGFRALGEIVRTHGLRATDVRSHPEQDLLFYADKRTAGNTLVSIDERFADFKTRYGPHPERKTWYEHTKALEIKLFPGGAPVLLTH
jgi:tRNA threonylcarbamoyladenosine biosynthesis protein TsaE